MSTSYTEWAKSVVNVVGVVNSTIIVGVKGIITGGVDGTIIRGVDLVVVRYEEGILVVLIDGAVVGSMEGVDRGYRVRAAHRVFLWFDSCQGSIFFC